MTLTDAQIVDLRRWLGYPLASATGVETVYTPDSPRVSFTARLEALSASEETVLVERFLDKLALLEQAILDAADNLDTDTAGPWKANHREISQRKSLYNSTRREMCAFLGFEPGPSLGTGAIFATRC